MVSMRRLRCSSKIEPTVWDRQAANLGGGFFHCHASAIYSAQIIGAEPLFIEARDKANRCVGLAVGTLLSPRFWPFSRYCRIASFPSTPIAGGDQEAERRLLDNIERKLKRSGVFKIEFASYHSPNSKDLLPSSGYEIGLRHEYKFDLGLDIDSLFKLFHKKKRQQVRKAEKNGIKTYEVNSIEAVELVEHFRKLSLERRGLPGSSVESRAKAARRLLFESGRTRVLISYLSDKAVGAELFGVFNGVVYGLRSGSSDIGNQTHSTVHLNWTAIQLFKEQGFTTYSLGGARKDEESLRNFKKKLGGKETPQPTGGKILSKFGAQLESIRGWLKGF